MKGRFMNLKVRLSFCLLAMCWGDMPSVADGVDATNAAPKKVAAIVTVYHHNSHADVIVSRILQTMTLDGTGQTARLQLAALYTDQVPSNDISRKLVAEYRFPIYDTVSNALTLGAGALAVDGVLLVAEHGQYPRSDTGSIQYPKRRLFEEIVRVFKASGRVAPVFVDKHLADNWQDAKWIYDTAREMKIPLMAGSSLPVLWRFPPLDIQAGARLDQIVAVSYHTLDAYGFHALEMVQALVERRRGGETGIRSVQCLTNDAVWKAGESGIYDPALLQAALGRLRQPPRAGKTLAELVKKPVLFVIDYADGLRACILTLNGAVGEWSVAWRVHGDPAIQSTLFWTQEARPFMHFTYLYRGIEEMILTGKPAWPVERTLLTSGALDKLLVSQKEGGRRLKTKELMVRYTPDWTWQQPPPPPPDRPINGQ
jgi:hypothetical protein